MNVYIFGLFNCVNSEKDISISVSASVMNGFCANLALISVIFHCNFLGLSVRQCWHVAFAGASKVDIGLNT